MQLNPNSPFSDYPCLEQALLDCFHQVVAATCRPELEVDTAIQQKVLNTLIEGISQAIITHGMKELHTDVLRDGLGTLLAKLYR